MASVFAQEDITVGKKKVKRGDVLVDLPDGLDMQAFVTLATTGKLGDEKPAPAPEKKEPDAAKAK